MNAIESEPALSADSLSKSYSSRAGTYLVLDEASFAVPRGAFVSLLGPSGAGKTTLLNILAGLDSPDRGAVRIFGKPPDSRPPIAYMQQKDLLLEWRTLWDNILLGPELRSRAERARCAERARDLVREFKLEGFTRAYPAELSGGMRQRAALIRTLLCEKEILLLDEPFGALDALTRRALQGHLLRVWRQMGKTVVLVTHDVEEALRLSTRIVLLSSRPGRVLDTLEIALPQETRSDSPESLRLKADILRRLGVDETDTRDEIKAIRSA